MNRIPLPVKIVYTAFVYLAPQPPPSPEFPKHAVNINYVYGRI
jgi:hypothetical protein